VPMKTLFQNWALMTIKDRSVWDGKIGFLGFKVTLTSAIVAIYAVELLKVFTC